MKKLIFKPIAITGIFAISLFGCASSTENTENVEAEAQAADEPLTIMDREQLANTKAGDFGELFEEVDETENYDILSLARTEESLSTFVELVEQSGLDTSFRVLGDRNNPITVFIPTNEAFRNLPKERYDYLTDPENKAELVRVLQAHIMPSEVPSSQFSGNQVIETADGGSIPVDTEMNGTLVRIGGNATIVRSDIEASNGIIHIVDGVIMPTDSDDMGLGTY